MLGTAAEQVIAEAGPGNFSGKVVIDATNPLDFSGGFPPKLAISGEDSLGERVQRALPDAKVVKAFNTIGNQYFVDPSFPEGKPTMLIAGDDEAAKRTVGEVLADFGWPDPVDIGGIEGARELEAICIAWVKIGGEARRLGPRIQTPGRLAGAAAGQASDRAIMWGHGLGSGGAAPPKSPCFRPPDATAAPQRDYRGQLSDYNRTCG